MANTPQSPRESSTSRSGGERSAIPFRTRPEAQADPSQKRPRQGDLRFLPQSADDVLATFDTMSRRITDLARELNCLGYFENDDDRPRAA